MKKLKDTFDDRQPVRHNRFCSCRLPSRSNWKDFKGNVLDYGVAKSPMKIDSKLDPVLGNTIRLTYACDVVMRKTITMHKM